LFITTKEFIIFCNFCQISLLSVHCILLQSCSVFCWFLKWTWSTESDKIANSNYTNTITSNLTLCGITRVTRMWTHDYFVNEPSMSLILRVTNNKLDQQETILKGREQFDRVLLTLYSCLWADNWSWSVHVHSKWNSLTTKLNNDTWLKLKQQQGFTDLRYHFPNSTFF
jgi:hypothetical protein